MRYETAEKIPSSQWICPVGKSGPPMPRTPHGTVDSVLANYATKIDFGHNA
ncbi:hypothetical protein BH09ACT7_BH09ACT7_06310 [soil metagenome]